MNAMTDQTAFAAAMAAAEARLKAEEDAEAERKARVRAAGREAERIAPGSAGWIIILTKGQREHGVRERLVKQGFEVYLPMRLLNPEQAKRRGVTALPLFPRMLFARATLDADRWQVIFSTIGVTRVLCDPHKPRGVRTEFVDLIRRREVGGFIKAGLVDPSRPPPVREKDPRKWVKLADVVDGLISENVDERRKSLLVSLLTEGRGDLSMKLR